MSREEGIELAVRALYQAADEDSATGGPDLVRGIYPTVATITADGLRRRARRTPQVGGALRLRSSQRSAVARGAASDGEQRP